MTAWLTTARASFGLQAPTDVNRARPDAARSSSKQAEAGAAASVPPAKRQQQQEPPRLAYADWAWARVLNAPVLKDGYAGIVTGFSEDGMLTIHFPPHRSEEWHVTHRHISNVPSGRGRRTR